MAGTKKDPGKLPNLTVQDTKWRWVLRAGAPVLAVAAATEARAWLEACCQVKPAFITFYPCIMLVAMTAGFVPGIITTFLSAAAADYFFIEPYRTLAITDLGDTVSLALFVVMGLILSAVAGELNRVRHRDKAAAERKLAESEDRFQTIVAGVKDYAIYMLDPDGRVASWNTGAERIKGWSAAEVLGQDFSLFYPPEAAKNGVAHQHLRHAAAHGTFSEEAPRRRKDGTTFWAEVAITALRSRNGSDKLRGFIKVVHDTSERRRAVREIAENRSQLASVFESAMDAIITIDSAQRIKLFNAAAVAMFRCPLEQALGQPIEQFIPQPARQAHAEHIRNFAATGTTSRAMGRLGILHGLRADGGQFPIEASISQVELDGQKLFTVILRDITDRLRAEERQTLLLRELAHRVKNTLAVVQSIAAQTSRFALPDQFNVTFAARLRALAYAHDLLTRSEWEGATLADVVRLSFTPYETDADVERWRIAGPDIWMSANEAVTLSLAFHELATNAAKFGALSNESGTVDVHWDVRHDPQPASIEVRWLETGGPPVNPPTRKGFGSTLLERAIAHELVGTTHLCFEPGGLACSVRFPLSQKVRVRT